MSANTGLTVTRAMKADFDACMTALSVTDSQPYKDDLRDVLAGYGQQYAARWLAGWRETLESK